MNGSISIISTLDETPQRSNATSRLSQLRNAVRGGRAAQQDEFNRILEIAHNIAKKEPAALQGLIRLLGYSVKARAMTAVLRTPGDITNCMVTPDDCLFSPTLPVSPGGLSLEDLKQVVVAPTLNLGMDIILPWPWNRKRIVNSLCNLRPGGEWGQWRQDTNHSIEYWLPMGVAWVHGGNHSLTAGVVNGSGTVVPEFAYDISAVYDHVKCDGLTYRRAHDGSLIAPVSDLDMAALFETGRISSSL